MFLFFGLGSVDFFIYLISGIVLLSYVLDFEFMVFYFLIVIVFDVKGGMVEIIFNVIVVD